MKRRRWKGFWQLADVKIWVASTVPVLIVLTNRFSNIKGNGLFWFIPAIVSIYLIEIAKNGINEYIDFKTGVDRNISEDNKTPFSGGKKTIVQGKLTLKEVLMITIVCYTFASIIGLFIISFREFNVLYIGFLGIGLSIIYSLPPFQLAYRGFGELTVGVTFGPLLMMGMELLLTKTITFEIFMLSIPVGLLIANVLIINEFPDYEADKAGNKKNWVVRLGKKRALIIHKMLYYLTYGIIVFNSVYFDHYFWLISLVTIKLAYDSIKNAEQHYDDIQQLMLSNLRTVQTYQAVGLSLIISGILIQLGG
jgi:1,4-dihydroxy-2-naphthoate octaprenyltransferase